MLNPRIPIFNCVSQKETGTHKLVRLVLLLLVTVLKETNTADTFKTCIGDLINPQNHPPCRPQSVISVTHVRAGYDDANGGECPGLINTQTCNTELDETPSNQEVLEFIRTNCDGKLQCDQLMVPDTSLSLTNCPTPGQATYYEVEYECVPKETDRLLHAKCVGNPIEIQCGQDKIISIDEMYFADNGPDPSCGDGSLRSVTYRCLVPISNLTNADYAQNILSKCDGKQSCENGISAQYSYESSCATTDNAYTEYVILAYTCIPDPSITLPPIYESTENTTEGETTLAPTTPQPDNGENIKRILYIAIPVGVVVLIIVIVLAVVCGRRLNKNDHKQDDEDIEVDHMGKFSDNGPLEVPQTLFADLQHDGYNYGIVDPRSSEGVSNGNAVNHDNTDEIKESDSDIVVVAPNPTTEDSLF